MAWLQIPAKALILVAVVFLALILVQLRLAPDAEEEKPAANQESPQVSRVQISKDGQLMDMSTEPLLTPSGSQELIEASIGFLAAGSTNLRRATAIELAYIAGDPTEQEKLRELSAGVKTRLREALLRGLEDSDTTVAKSCAEALIGWWRMAPSPAVSRSFQQGAAAYEAGQMDVALNTFRSIEELGGPVPPDLYRMKAEVYLARLLPEQALAECRRALALEPKHFVALFDEARAYAQLGEERKALEALGEALSIYEGFEAAQQLRAELYHAA